MDLFDFYNNLLSNNSTFDSVNILKGSCLGDKEFEDKSVYYFQAIGIPKENIKYLTRFDSKRKIAFLDIDGKYIDEETGFSNDVEVSIPIDTTLYDSYAVDIKDGVIKVTLVRIKESEPLLRDLNKEA